MPTPDTDDRLARYESLQAALDLIDQGFTLIDQDDAANNQTWPIAKVLGVTMEDVMGEPIQQVPQASPEDVAFFREYAGMTDEEKDRYRQALKIMFPDKGESGG